MNSIVNLDVNIINNAIKRLFNDFIEYKKVLSVLRLSKHLYNNDKVLCFGNNRYSLLSFSDFDEDECVSIPLFA